MEKFHLKKGKALIIVYSELLPTNLLVYLRFESSINANEVHFYLVE